MPLGLWIWAAGTLSLFLPLVLMFRRGSAQREDRGRALGDHGDRSLGAYRTAAEALDQPTRDAEARDLGEAILSFDGAACPFCKKSEFTSGNPIVMNAVCRPASRIPMGCSVPGTHVHRSCGVCKAVWLSTMPGKKTK